MKLEALKLEALKLETPKSEASQINRQNRLPQPGTGKPDKELHEALEEFEALFASTLLRTAREENGSGWLGGESSAGSDGIMEFAESHIAKSMAKQNAFGIAKTLSKFLNR